MEPLIAGLYKIYQVGPGGRIDIRWLKVFPTHDSDSDGYRAQDMPREKIAIKGKA